jgi:hypothetical protein
MTGEQHTRDPCSENAAPVLKNGNTSWYIALGEFVIKWKKKKIPHFRIHSKNSYWKIVKLEAVSILLVHIQVRSLSWLGTAIKSGRVRLVL